MLSPTFPTTGFGWIRSAVAAAWPSCWRNRCRLSLNAMQTMIAPGSAVRTGLFGNAASRVLTRHTQRMRFTRASARHDQAARSQRIDYLDGIRGVAVVAVICSHWLSAYTPLGGGGYIGVTAFFVLSGYVITSVLWRKRIGYWAFLGNRVRRLYPALLGLLIVGVALTAVVPASAVHPGVAIKWAAVAAVQAMAPWAIAHFQTEHNLFAVTWSLAIEWYFYIAWAAVLLALKRSEARTAEIAKGALATGGVLWLVSLLLPDAWSYFGPVSNSGALLVGCALAIWVFERPTPPDWWSARTASWVSFLGLGAAAAWTLVGGSKYDYPYRVSVLPLTCALTVLLIVGGRWAPTSAPSLLLSWRPVAGLGRVSYSLYLWHTIPLLVMTGSTLPVPRPVIGAVGVAAAAALTWVSFVMLERPFMRSRASSLGGPSRRDQKAQARIGSSAGART